MRALREEALALGAFRAELVRVEDISTDVSFRSLCASNACGNYGKNYMCPPDVGSIEELMQELRTYETALVYQTVGLLEDSYDFEGMMAAGQRMNRLTATVRRKFRELGLETGTTSLRRSFAALQGKSWNRENVPGETVRRKDAPGKEQARGAGSGCFTLAPGGAGYVQHAENGAASHAVSPKRQSVPWKHMGSMCLFWPRLRACGTLTDRIRLPISAPYSAVRL